MVAVSRKEEFTGKNISPAEEVFLQIDELYDEAKNWADGAEIEDEKQHDAAKAVYDALHDAGKKADDLRKEEKKPLDEQVKAIQDRFNPYIQPKKGKVDLGKNALNTILAKWRQKVEAKKADKDAARANKAASTGLGLRTTYAPRLTNLREAVAHYWGSNPTAFEQLVCDLAAKDVRAGKHSIPGFIVEEEKKAI